MKAFVITGLDHLPSPETQWVRDAFTGCQTQHILFKDFGITLIFNLKCRDFQVLRGLSMLFEGC